MNHTCFHQKRTNRLRRRGSSFIEVMAGMVLVSVLFTPVFGILSASSRIWQQFESGHGSTSNRQMAMQEIDRRLSSAKAIESYRADEFTYQDGAGIKKRVFRKQRVKQNGTSVFDLVCESSSPTPQSEILAEDIGVIRVAQLATTPAAGELLEIRLESVVNPKVTTPRKHSSRLTWKRA